MRLLNTLSGRFSWIEDPRKVRYAILSHTWSRNGEQSYHDIVKLQESATWRRGAWISLPLTPRRLLVRRVGSFFSAPTLSAKIKGACKIARERGYRFIWIDTCCIDKTSSAELSEAINSMYLWYTLADVCFVYLADVPRSPDGPQTGKDSRFWWSRWHDRGWTLQELIAPRYMLFFDCEWSVLGSKIELASTLAERTGVYVEVLVHALPLRRISVADRMQWASKRRTTRVEDEAYCLMGLFGVHMPTIYGEGRKAFIRLQQEIVRTIPDQSLFVWGPTL
ncbi:HET-domain-containing protein, partial [Trametes cingulata]